MGRSVQVGDHPDDLPCVNEIKRVANQLVGGDSRLASPRKDAPADRFRRTVSKSADAATLKPDLVGTPALAANKAPVNRSHGSQVAARKTVTSDDQISRCPAITNFAICGRFEGS